MSTADMMAMELDPIQEWEADRLAALRAEVERYGPQGRAEHTDSLQEWGDLAYDTGD